MSHVTDYQDYDHARAYDQRISANEALRVLTRALVNLLQPQDRMKILDVGAGTGRMGIALSSCLSDGFIAGIDTGRGMLRVAREKVIKLEIENLHLIRGKAEMLPVRACVIDAATLMLSFHHFTEPDVALAEIRRTLKPAGALVSMDPVIKEAEDEEDVQLNEIIEEVFQTSHGPEFRYFTAQQLRDKYTRAGFEISAHEPQELIFDQVGWDGIPMGPHWIQVYDTLRFRQRKDLLRRFDRDYFALRRQGDQLLVKGTMRWVLFKVTKP